MYQLIYKCTDKIGSWESNSCVFLDNDNSAINWAKSELKRIRNKYNDITISNAVLIQPDLSPMFTKGDRKIANIS